MCDSRSQRGKLGTEGGDYRLPTRTGGLLFLRCLGSGNQGGLGMGVRIGKGDCLSRVLRLPSLSEINPERSGRRDHGRDFYSSSAGERSSGIPVGARALWNVRQGLLPYIGWAQLEPSKNCSNF